MKILVGVDGSPGSDAAVEMVGRLAPDEVNDIQLYFSGSDLDQTLRFETHELLREATKKSIADRLFGHAIGLLPRRLRHATRTVVGHKAPAAGLLAAVARFQPELIAVGATGLGPVGRLLVGGVSRAVAVGASVPVLVGRQNDRSEAEPLKVLLAFGHPDDNDERQEFLLRLAWPGDTIARAIHVEDPTLVPEAPDWLLQQAETEVGEPFAKQWAQSRQACIEREERLTESYCQGLPPHLRTAAAIVATGNVGQEVVRHAIDGEDDLVIVGGPHRHSRWPRFSLGRTPEYVLSHAPCSVLLIPHHPFP